MSKKRIKLIVFLAIILLVAIIFIFVILPRLTGPSQGSVLNPSVVEDAKSKQLAFDFTPKTITGVYVSFTVPSSMQVTPNSKMIGPVIETHNFAYRDVETWNLAITVLSVPSGNLKDDSSYSYRKQHPDVYQESHTIIANQPVTIMADKTSGGFKQVAFLVHGGRVADISLYGDDASGVDKLKTTLMMVITSWQWLLG
ncbi:MAG TPA: hypothetical protein VNG90_04670 [Candidatus Acidoferrum sp.]|nr:hypothetical protein [Candidatus Acidoferrum sp.]